MHIPAGQHVALVGPSGSGKTTVARLIARLTDPTFGSVKVGGVDLIKVANSDLRSRLIVVPQEPFLFAETILYNLQFVDPTADEHAMLEAFNQLGLLDWIQSLPDGLNTHVGQRGASLSAGERQLVSLVRAFLVKPDVLVLDEATSSVDSLTEVRISRALDRLASGRTTISIAHRLSTAARAERVIMLVGGRIVEDGSHTQLMIAGNQYAKLYSAWLESTSSGDS
jgi:putative ABC transport system ATP-binding protein